MTTPLLAERVMKARHTSECPVCRQLISIGQTIAKCPHGMWMHLSCWPQHKASHSEQP